MKYNLAIIGGGAAGMIAAVTAKRKRPGLSVVILERMDRLGKKILATGNGRCNYTNMAVSQMNYYGTDTGFVSHPLSVLPVEATISFFQKLGIHPRVEGGGKVYPYSGTAGSVIDCLRFELDRLGVELITGFDTNRIRKDRSTFNITDKNGVSCTSDKLILAAGGRASPNLGSDGSGFKLLEDLGHRVTPLSPALTQIHVKSAEVKALQGIRFDGSATAFFNGMRSETIFGDILFTARGLSGPPIFQISLEVANAACDTISLDVLPEISKGELNQILRAYRSDLSHLTMEHFFAGLVNKRIGNLVARRTGIEKLSLPVYSLSDSQITIMAEILKDLRFDIDVLNGYDSAQVTFGGAATESFDRETMESKLVPDLYAAGEILDICGDCGGYNLQWAWSSGYVAGLSASSGS